MSSTFPTTAQGIFIFFVIYALMTAPVRDKEEFYSHF
jgi:hypothetical protein